jgi:hypothetical protein
MVGEKASREARLRADLSLGGDQVRGGQYLKGSVLLEEAAFQGGTGEEAVCISCGFVTLDIPREVTESPRGLSWSYCVA